jgi:hypothetical protein
MTYPIDKLGLIVQALQQTGNNSPSAADDGSEEWNVASAAYESALEYMLDQGDWKQLTTVATLNATPVAPTDDEFDTAFAKPPDCIHVIWLRANYGNVSDDGFFAGGVPIPYQILTNQIVVNLFSEPGGASPPPGTPSPTITMKYVSSAPPSGLVDQNGNPLPGAPAPGNMLRTFFTALERFIFAGIYRGLNKDLTEARLQEQAARILLQEARTRSDQEQPKRAVFNSRITAARRVRRPMPETPPAWGGTGIPG